MAFIGSWFAFAIIWYIIIYYHGDLEEDHLPDKQEANGWNMQNFASVFLFSIETQHTIGYGGRMMLIQENISDLSSICLGHQDKQ
jgi:potassium inwardly-rectifying channel subfamily J